MAETDTRPWSELLPDLLSAISNKLQDPVELLAFRGTCHSWRLASSNAADNLKESLLHQIPWLLCQESGNKEECVVHNFTTKGKYNIKLPDLVGTDILGSFQGWLLLFKSELGKGQIFFFCPFSRHKLSLPDLPESKIFPNSIAVCNSPPTSISDRTICVIMHEEYTLPLVIYILRPLSETWEEVTYSFINIFEMDDVTGALLEDENLILFYHKDKTKLLMINIAENNESETMDREGVVIHLNEEASNTFSDNVGKLFKRALEAMENYLESEDIIVKEFLLMDGLACAFVFGTWWYDSHGKELMLFNESYNVENFDTNAIMLLILRYVLNNKEYIDKKLDEPTLDFMDLQRGIWLHPRLFRP